MVISLLRATLSHSAKSQAFQPIFFCMWHRSSLFGLSSFYLIKLIFRKMQYRIQRYCLCVPCKHQATAFWWRVGFLSFVVKYKPFVLRCLSSLTCKVYAHSFLYMNPIPIENDVSCSRKESLFFTTIASYFVKRVLIKADSKNLLDPTLTLLYKIGPFFMKFRNR